MPSFAFHQVDVFTDTPTLGNPLAVVADAQGLSEATMQAFARWTNLSETTFLLPPTQPQAHYRVRIFSPGGELPFAGHPTLGSCAVWRAREQAAGRTPPDRVVQECAQGLVPVRLEPKGQGLAFAAPALQRHTPEPSLIQAVCAALGLPQARVRAAQELDNGPRWLSLLVDEADAVLHLSPDHAALKSLGQKVGVAHIQTAQAAINSGALETRDAGPILTVRAFAAAIGVDEDPVTGSLNAALAQWLMAERLAPERYLAHQGHALGRAGRVHLQRDAEGQVWVGGQVAACVVGLVQLGG